ncbi:hypothetical protein Taro_009697 [Colocasia esculenta]|uniref:Uncharacterized protein n=1 Tax=Colocasia esculenta TaxID=4460 RepID=A0A843UAQ0_COLES|nr:hypothetical protein [Colocasia esculenta]
MEERTVSLTRLWRLVDVEELAGLEVMSQQVISKLQHSRLRTRLERADVWWSSVLRTQFGDDAMEVA